MRSVYFVAALLAGLLLVSHQVIGSSDKTETKMDKAPAMTESAVFAGGCFWCTESDFEKLDGVVEVISGYTGGSVANPSYKQVSGGGTGHAEAVKVIYDPQKVTYQQLLDYFWRHVNPTDAGGQFVDRGSQYRSAIFYANEEQHKLAEASKKALAGSGVFNKPIVTEISPLGQFYPAEDYHQDYYKKSPINYKWYRSGSGRDQFLQKVWGDMDSHSGMKSDKGMKSGPAMMSEEEAMKDPSMGSGTKQPMARGGDSMMKDEAMNKEGTMDTMGKKMEGGMDSKMAKAPMYSKPSDEVLRKKLTPLQYQVTQEEGTERAFNNEYWDNKREGIYVDIVSGEPLFSSQDKFKSGTGWPSFTKPLEPDNIVEKTDRSFFMVRTEVRSKHGDSHLGHLFDDGPAPTGLRYCMNSASLRFIPKEDLEKEGYGQYLKLFK